MLDLTQLGKTVAASVAKNEFGESYWSYMSSAPDNDFAEMSGPVRALVEDLVKKVRQAIPDDIDFVLSLGEDGTALGLEFNDGPMAGSFEGGTRFETDDEMLETVNGTDWDEFRTHALNQTSIFDFLLEDAALQPINIPSSAEAAKRWAGKLPKLLAKAHQLKPVPEFVAVLRESTGRFEVKGYKNKDAMISDFVDALTCRYQVLAILQNGGEVPYPQIESYKRQAIDLLDPGSISRAKAEGRL